LKLWFFIPLCPAPSIDAQDKAGHGRFLLLRFLDEFVKSRCGNLFVIPAQAGIQLFQWVMDSRLRGSDGLRTFYGSIFSSHVKENEVKIIKTRHTVFKIVRRTYWYAAALVNAE